MSSKKRGLVFIMNDKPAPGETFQLKRKYRFVPEHLKRDTFIIIEKHEFNICVISFYDKTNENSVDKFKQRFAFSGSHVRSIFKACLEAFYLNETKKHQCVLVFHAANNINEIKEDNPRNSAYNLFLRIYFKDYEEYVKQGSIALNTLMLYHGTYPYKKEADKFFQDFEHDVTRETANERTRLLNNLTDSLSEIENRKAKKNKT